MGLKIFSEQFRDEILKLNLKTPPDIVLGLVNLSGSALYSSYIDALGKDAIIKTDKASVSLTDPGDVLTDAVTPRRSNLNKNLNKPDNTNEIILNDFNVIDPGDIVNDSINPRRSNLNRNLQTPPDILGSISSGHLDSLGKDTTIGDSVVLNPGSVDDAADVERVRLFNKNKPINTSDPSENDPLFSFLSRGGYTYTSLLQSIGNLTLINDLSIPNAISVSSLSNQTPEVSLQLQLQQNRFFPVEFNQYESTVLSLKANQNTTPYINAYNAGIFNYGSSTPQQYEPSSFLNLRTSTNPLSLMTDRADPLSILLNGATPPLENETLLMNIAALELKFNFDSRIKRSIERETLGRFNIFNASTNPIAAANMIRDPYGWFNLFERNYEISTPSSNIGKALEFTASLAGVINPLSSDFSFNLDDDIMPKCFGNQIESGDGTTPNRFQRFVNDLIGINTQTRKQDRDGYFIRRTGSGQRYSLFYSVSRNKYQPDFLSDNETVSFLSPEETNALRGIGGYFGIGGGQPPGGNFYIGEKTNNDPFYLLQDADGHQVRSNETLTEVIKNNLTYEEPGYSGSKIDGGSRPSGVSEYGSLTTNFIWKSENSQDTVFDFATNTKSKEVSLEDITRNSSQSSIDDSVLSSNKLRLGKFRECSILDVTSRLANKKIQTSLGEFNSPIDQTITKFYDGYDFMSRGNATITPQKIERVNKQGEVIGYRYKVPGLDASGKREDREMYNEAEMCRVWTKARPYSKITDLVRYKELIRKERNSVIDRFGNYNIFPSELNVNTGYGNPNNGAEVEFFGEKRARKYMFSIENLAWRDYKANTYFSKESELPNCEKGPNGGRVMWFPPYDISFSDNTSSNWTTHQFLGRAEPIYTYNNTERTGTLSWKIVVDHPSILNLLTKKELAGLNDNEVDELLSAFWSGCLEFDVFELARIWNQFSQSDIDYFKSVLSSLDLSNNNPTLKNKLETVIPYKQASVENTIDISREKPQSKVNGFNLFFENDVPLIPSTYNKSETIYDTGKIQPYDVLFKRYYELSKYINTEVSADSVKSTYRNGIFDNSWVKYHETIGINSIDNYMESNQIDPKYFGMEKQYKDIENELSNPKYIGFNLRIKVEAYASPLGPDANTPTYNTLLAKRRFSSVIKWLVSRVMSKDDLGKIYFQDENEVTEPLLDNLLNGFSGTSITFKRDNGKPNGDKDDIIFELVESSGITPENSIKQVNINPEKIGDVIYFIVNMNEGDDNVEYCCFETTSIKNDSINKNILPNNIPPSRVGALEVRGERDYADYICSVLSIVSSYSRRVTLNIEVVDKPNITKSKEPVQEEDRLTIESDSRLSSQNVTKRDIAQKIINKMITECDYFELLKDKTPIVYNTLKEKLKYFQPAFHAITPEGLNSRLTFLQQCLRPGETIKRKFGEETCDASNTAFGKPPICVLRIGDFYHTKIAIDTLNISYDPLVFDLNPEGIGVQPMIANIQLNFKFIGGSGLRKYVDELQNALSFNYYANADIYDDRTFANKDQFERNLINLERSFFDDNTLDLIPIVAAAERIIPNEITQNTPYGTLGVITSNKTPTTAGGTYSRDVLTSQIFDPSIVYQPYNVVTFDNKFYLRKADNEKELTKQNTLNGSQAPLNNTTYWNEIFWRNYGEQPFVLEFAPSTSTNVNTSETYFKWYEIQYMDLFKELYQTYGGVVRDNIKFNEPVYEENSILLDLVLNKNYNKLITNTDVKKTETLTITETDPFGINSINYPDELLPYLETDTSGKTNDKDNLLLIYDDIANDNNYKEFINLPYLSRNISTTLSSGKLSPIKNHLYPQNYLFKIGDGKSLISPNGLFNDSNRLNPGNLSGGSNKNAETGGIYFKDYTNHASNIDTILSEMLNEMEVKIKLNLTHFWHYNEKSAKVYNEYLEYFEVPHKTIFTDFLFDKLKSFIETYYNLKLNLVDSLDRNTVKLGALMTGISVVLEGYDINTDETKSYYYEVLPNEYKLSTPIIELFGYEPYLNYKTSSNYDYKLIDFEEFSKIIKERNLNVDNKLKFISLGNGSYFLKQLTKDADIIDLTSTEFTVDNNLPEFSFNDAPYPFDLSFIDYEERYPNGNFNVVNGIVLNDVLDKDGKSGETTTLSIKPTGGESKEGSFEEIYNMKYTFEKINYEFFEFSNKMLDVMISDKFINDNYDLDINFDSTKDFEKQIKETNVLRAGNLFYAGNGKLSDIKLNYYTFNENSLPSGSIFPILSTKKIIEDINKKIKYEYIVTERFTKTILGDFSSLIGKKIELSGLLDLLFIKFLSDLTDEDKAEILTKIKEKQPKKGETDGDKNKESQKNVRYRKIERTLNSIFTIIKNYVTEMNKTTTALNSSYKVNYGSVVNKMHDILIKNSKVGLGPFPEEITPITIADALIKGNVDDYTLIIKETKDVLNSVLNNYNLFTNSKDVTNININNENAPVIEQTEITDRYKKD